MGTFDLGPHLLGQRRVGRTPVLVEFVRAIVDEVDVAAKAVSGADRDRDRDRRAREALAERVDGRLVGGVLLVHAVDHDQGRHAGCMDHLPGHLRAHGNHPGRGDNQHRCVGNRERFDNLAGEVLKPRRVDEVHAVAVPVAVSDRKSDAHRVALLLRLEIEQRGPLFRGPNALRRTRGVQQRFAEGRLAIVAVTDDGDGTDAIRRGRRHGESTPDRTDEW